MTVTIYDTQNHAPSDVDEQTAAQALLQGTHVVLADSKFNMVDNSGKAWDVPGTGVADALSNGWNLGQNLSTSNQQKAQELADQRGPFDTGVFAAGNSAFSQDAFKLANKVTGISPEQDQIERESQRLAEKQHPTAASVGHVLGGGLGAANELPAFAVGEGLGGLAEKGLLKAGEAGVESAIEKGALSAGEKATVDALTTEAVETAAQTSLKRQLAAKVANYATQGAVMSSPQAVTEAALGDPKGAAESLFWGTGLGAILGAGTFGMGKVASKAGEIFDAEAPKLADQMVLKGAGLKNVPSEAQKEMADFLHDEINTKPGMGKAETRAKIEAVVKSSEEQVSQLTSKLDGLINDHPELQQYAFNPSEVAVKVEKEIAPTIAGTNTAEERLLLNKIVDQIANKEKYAKGIASFEDAATIKNELKPEMTSAASSPTELVKQQASQIIDREFQTAAQNVVNEGTKRGVGSAQLFTDLLKQSKLNSKAQAALTYGTANEVGATPGSFDLLGGTNLPVLALLSHGPHAAAAAMAYKAAEYVIKHMLQDKGLNTGAFYLNKLLKDPENLPFIGAAIAHNTVKATTSHLDAIGSLFSGTNVKRVSQYAINENIKKVIGGGQGLTTQQQFAKASDKIATLAKNPDALADHLAPVVSLVSGHAPGVSQEYVNTAHNAIVYLNDTMPKNPNPTAQPFENTDWEPASKQIKDWDMRLGAVIDPGSIIAKIANGTASKEEIETVKKVYPQYSQYASAKIIEAGLMGDKKPKGPALLKLSLFIDKPVGKSMKNLASYQSTYATPGQNQKPQRSAASKIKDMPSWDPNHRNKE